MNPTTTLSIVLRHLIPTLQAIQRELHEIETQTAAIKKAEPPKQETVPKETGGTRKALLTAKEAAAHLGISKVSLYRLITGEKIPHYRIGRRILISEQHLTTWLAGFENVPRGAPRD
jgi:excisionase family DNA binding protein